MAICESAVYSSGNHRPVPKTPPGDDVTVLLARWRKGSAEAESQLLERVQGELRRLAAGYMRHERGGQTLQPVTSCSPCVTVGLSPEMLGQFWAAPPAKTIDPLLPGTTASFMA